MSRGFRGSRADSSAGLCFVTLCSGGEAIFRDCDFAGFVAKSFTFTSHDVVEAISRRRESFVSVFNAFIPIDAVGAALDGAIVTVGTEKDWDECLLLLLLWW